MKEGRPWRDPDPSWPGAERRHPDPRDPSYISLRLLREAIEHFAHQIKAPALLLDLGCGAVPYEPLFDSEISYVSVDMERRYPVRMIADISRNLPFADASFDALLCTQVLEHVADPELVVGEIHRVLKPGAIGLVTVPFAWEIHHYPKDWHRFTIDSLEQLLHRFSISSVSVLEPSDMAWVQSKLIRWHRCQPDSGWRKFVIGKVNKWMWWRRERFTDQSHPGNLLARIQK